MNPPEFPFVSVVVPMRNEKRYIERCLAALVTQDYPADRIEILVVDGMSDDDSAERVRRLARTDPRITLLENPHRITPVAFNVGIRHARGEIICIVSSHAIVASDYVRRCVEALAATGADNVGGPMRAESDTYTGRAIALATGSPFGVGGARFHYADTPQWVDTVYMGAYPRAVFDRIGLFDEELVRNQDDELNFRLTRAGGKIWLDPRIQSVYFSRSNLRALWKQYFEYGYWKVRVIQKHRRPASPRHLVPMLFVLAMMSGAALSLVTQTWLWFALVALPYACASLAASAWIAARHGWKYFPLLPVIFFVLHAAYGAGFWVGLVKWNLFARARVHGTVS